MTNKLSEPRTTTQNKYMKKTLLLAALTALGSTAAFAQVDVTVTGSSAFRAITIDRTFASFDAAGRVAQTNDATIGLITISGTMQGSAPTLGTTPVKVRLSFSGSAQGMIDVKNSNPINVAVLPSESTPGVSNSTRVPDLALSDVFPGSATPPIAESAFNRFVLGVVPFTFARNNALVGITNITQAQANLLMVASGNFGMPATFLGGSSVNPVYLIGRDSESGTRISVEKDINFVGSPLLWTTNGAGTYVVTNGLPSGGLLRNVVKGKSDAIGYMGLSDFNAISAFATSIPFNGVGFSHTNVNTGSYSLWGYEHMVNKAGGLSAQKSAVRDAIKAAITNPGFQQTNTLYNVNFSSLTDMHVERGADGAVPTSLDF